MNVLRYLLLVSCGWSMASGAEPSPAVATVGTESITLRQVEDATLAREGAELIEEWVRQNLDRVDYPKLHDDDLIVAIGFNRLTRRELADALLRKGVGNVREELVQLAVVRQAIVRENITLTEDDRLRTYQRQARTFEDSVAKRGGTRMDFANFLHDKYRMTPEQFRAQPAMEVLAGLEALARKRAVNEANDQELLQWFNDHQADYHQDEAVDLSLLYIPYQQQPGLDGAPTIVAQERERLMKTMLSIRAQIEDKQTSFAQSWVAFGSAYDPQARGGHVGWVTRDGKRRNSDAKTHIIAADAMTAAWAVTTFPTLLPPIAGAEGIEIINVLAHRPAREGDFASLRDRVRNDRIDQTIETRIEALRQELRRAQEVKLLSIPDAIDAVHEITPAPALVAPKP